MVRGAWGAAPVAGLEAENGDLVVERQRMSSFNSTTLDTKLRELGTQNAALSYALTRIAEPATVDELVGAFVR